MLEYALLLIFAPALLYLVVSVALILIGGTLHVFQNWWRRRPRRSSLTERSHVRAGAGIFLVMLAIGLWAHGVPALLRPIGGYVIGGLAGLGLLYLVVGVHGSQGARFDLLQAFWWCAAAAGCAALLVFKGIV